MSTGAASNRTGTLRVHVDDSGSLLGVHIDRAEMRYGGPSLADAILELYRTARAQAIDRRRAELLDYGMAPDVVDRIHPPVGHRPTAPPPPTRESWLRPL